MHPFRQLIAAQGSLTLSREITRSGVVVVGWGGVGAGEGAGEGKGSRELRGSFPGEPKEVLPHTKSDVTLI